MRSSFRHATNKKALRSQSKASNTSNTSSSSSVSTASSTTTSSTTNSSDSPTRDSVSLSSASTAKRKPLSRRTSSSTYRGVRGGGPLEQMHVTIAPIAPTVLKTEVWEEGFGDDGAGSDDGFGWRERLWNHGADSKGKGRASRGRGKPADDDGSDASGTPVELVYVPPFSGRYAYGFAGYEDEDDEDDEGIEAFGPDDEFLDVVDYAMHSPTDGASSAVYLHRETAAGCVGFEDYEATERQPPPVVNHRLYAPGPGSYSPGIPIPIPDDSEREHVDYFDPTPQTHTQNHAHNHRHEAVASPIPRLVVDHGAGRIPSVQEEDENDFFDADADYGNEYMQRSRSGPRGGYGGRNQRQFVVGSGGMMVTDERPSRSTSRTTSERSQSKSHSRTPSPAIEAILASGSADPSRSHLKRTNSASASATTSPSSPYASHLYPPGTPGRGRSSQQLDAAAQQGSAVTLGRSFSAGSLQSDGARGRSTSRTSSNAASSSMEGSLSPFAGSPDGSGSRTARAGSAYAGSGRMGGDNRESRDSRGTGERRGREPTKEKERERGRDRTTDKRLSVSVSASPEPPRGVEREASGATDGTAETSETSSSSRTVVPEGGEQEASNREEQQQQQQQETPIPPTTPPQSVAQPQPQIQDERRGRRRMTAEDYQREAEDLLRRAHPTPFQLSHPRDARPTPPAYRYYAASPDHKFLKYQRLVEPV
ncbi:hypothetical protein FA13DRAFT_1073465 [Coprinellus micaceus]|uniref:Uncharacterized protein n=1 Tax=Coprinellus micaceus TaxID=71717 RepID=A0A4Y7TQZ9_COPMI|nr:hypothetical protein FA13DRAFT_1073465 [Coprinellus micaceus]